MQLSLRKKVILVCLLIFVIVAIISAALFISSQKQKEADIARSVFTSNETYATYTDLLGNPVALENYLGKTVVAVSWASWSPFSAADLTQLNLLAEETQSEEVVFLAINRKETREQAQRYIATLPELANILVVIDVEDKFYTLTGGYAMPETVVFDNAGKIILHHRGELPLDLVRATLPKEN
jgi:thiol-disulfide isomerase/thioredoxin